jgi:acyl-CoA synthetase (NDP forming)
VRAVLAEPDIAGALAVNVGLDFPEFAEAVVGAARATGKPAVAFVADAPRIAEILRAGAVPVLPSPERAVRAWRALWQARPPGPRRLARRAPLPDDVARTLGSREGPLPYAQARRLLEAYGVRFCADAAAASPDEAVAAAEAIGYPVVMKAEAPGLTHKTDAGGVILDVREADAVRAAWNMLQARTGAACVVVQRQVGRGVELLLGARRDEAFGPLALLGTGGVLTEVVQDASVRLAPVPDDEAAAMLHEGARPRLLAGPRGLPPVEPAALTALVQALGDLIACEPRVLEVDINPVIAAGADLVAVDALVIIGEGRQAP